MQSEQLGAVVRTSGYSDSEIPRDIYLNAALEYSKQHAWEVSGETNPEIYLMGFSAGASAIAARAHLHPEVTRILLAAPSSDLGLDLVREGLMKFTGEVYILIGQDDEIVGQESGKIFYDLAKSASKKELFEVPHCDHKFKGEANGRIMSEAPFYAFAKGEKPQFPDPTGGIKLYD